MGTLSPAHTTGHLILLCLKARLPGRSEISVMKRILKFYVRFEIYTGISLYSLSINYLQEKF